MSFRIPSTGRKRPLALSAFADDDEEAEAPPQHGVANPNDSVTEQTQATGQAAKVHISTVQSKETPVVPPTCTESQPGAQSDSTWQGSSGSSQHAQQLVLQGIAHADARNWSGALSAWDAAAVLDPNNAALHEMRSQVLLEVGRVWEAVQAATSATQLRPNWAPGWATLGRAQLALGEVQLGLASLQAAARLDPADSDLAAELEGVQVLAQQQRAAGLAGTRLVVL